MGNQRYDRRSVLRATGAVTAGVAFASTVSTTTASAAEPVFAHGVASGDPLPDGVLLWTRVTPTPDATPGSGVGPRVNVSWEIATRPDFVRVRRRGRVATGPHCDHTVKVDVSGLDPATTYYYRFTLDGAVSAVGTTKTAPAANAALARLRFGVVSCSNLPDGYFAAYRYLADRDDLDAVLHLGDYIYEGGDGDVRAHEPTHEILTLADYRRRHAQYKTDEHLQRLHARVPFIATWDDHEVADNAWSGGAPNHQPDTEGDYAVRKAAAHQAYFEWMPVRHVADRIYRRLRFGLLAELSMLDLRSYRSEQVGPVDPALGDPTRTITGAEQLAWLEDGLVTSTARWKLVGNSVMIAPVQLPPLPAAQQGALVEMIGAQEGPSVNPDQWDGYQADRRRVLATLADNAVRDTVFLTGDIHSSWASDVPLDAALYPLTPSVATEFVCTSVTSDNFDEILGVPPRTTSVALEAVIQSLNRHVKYCELDSHGASVLEVTPDAVQMDWYYLANKADPAGVATYARSFRTRTGTQKVQSVGTPIGTM